MHQRKETARATGNHMAVTCPQCVELLHPTHCAKRKCPARSALGVRLRIVTQTQLEVLAKARLPRKGGNLENSHRELPRRRPCGVSAPRPRN